MVAEKRGPWKNTGETDRGQLEAEEAHPETANGQISPDRHEPGAAGLQYVGKWEGFLWAR